MASFLAALRPPRAIGAALLKGGTTRTLGLDVGERRIGVALSDPLGIVASPLMIISRRGGQGDMEEILSLVRKHEVGRIVVGLPRSLDGSLGQQALRVQEFIELLSQSSTVPVESWDERLSTVAAAREMRATGARPSQRRQRLDAVAASLVLQTYLDRQRAAPA